VLRVLRFDAPASAAGNDATGRNATAKVAAPLGILVQWNCHPEAMGSKNTQVTADFCAATVETLKKKYACPVAYFTGPVGGLMAPPDGILKDAQGRELKEGQWEYASKYGQRVADLAAKAIDAAEPIELGPIVVSAAPLAIPLQNPYYKAARVAGVLQREARVWTGDAEQPGPVATLADTLKTQAVVTEVAYLRLGELHLACIPGEIYPELIYGKFQDPVEAGADYPDAPLEKPLVEILPGKKVLLIGLANDEIGYIIPRRQWDQAAPFCYGRRTSQYGEINSCGPQVAPLLMNAFQRRVRAAR